MLTWEEERAQKIKREEWEKIERWLEDVEPTPGMRKVLQQIHERAGYEHAMATLNAWRLTTE